MPHTNSSIPETKKVSLSQAVKPASVLEFLSPKGIRNPLERSVMPGLNTSDSEGLLRRISTHLLSSIALELHPDRRGGNVAHDEFVEVREMLQILREKGSLPPELLARSAADVNFATQRHLLSQASKTVEIAGLLAVQAVEVGKTFKPNLKSFAQLRREGIIQVTVEPGAVLLLPSEEECGEKRYPVRYCRQRYLIDQQAEAPALRGAAKKSGIAGVEGLYESYYRGMIIGSDNRISLFTREHSPKGPIAVVPTERRFMGAIVDTAETILGKPISVWSLIENKAKSWRLRHAQIGTTKIVGREIPDISFSEEEMQEIWPAVVSDFYCPTKVPEKEEFDTLPMILSVGADPANPKIRRYFVEGRIRSVWSNDALLWRSSEQLEEFKK